MVRPWARAGFDCVCVDTANEDTTEDVGEGTIYYVEADVREFQADADDYRMAFAFPPCTHLAGSGARWWQEKGLSALAEGIELVAACHETISELDCPWMLENPVGALSTHWRGPDWTFDPFEYDGLTGDDEAYTKRTCLWTSDDFRMPAAGNAVDRDEADDRIHKMPPSENRAEKRSATPTGFAQAVYLAHEEDLPIRNDTTATQAQLVTDGGRSESVAPHHLEEPPEFEYEKGQSFRLSVPGDTTDYWYVKARVWNYDADTDSEITQIRAYKQYVIGEVATLGGGERLVTEGTLVEHYTPVSKEEAEEVL